MRATLLALPDCQPQRSVSKDSDSGLTLRVRRGPRTRGRRDGLTLLEVLLALAIFLFSMVALARLVTFATDRAIDIQGREAQLCQSKLAEIVAGVTPLSSAEGDFDFAPDWHYSIECEPSGYTNLWNVKVTVSRNHSDGSGSESILTQMVYDPTQRGSTLDPDPTTLTNSTDTGSSSGSSGSSGNQSGGGNTGNTPTGGAGAGAAKPGAPGAPKAPTGGAGGAAPAGAGGAAPAGGGKAGGTGAPATGSKGAAAPAKGG